MHEEHSTTIAVGEQLDEFIVRWTKPGLEQSHEKELELPISFGRDKENTLFLPSKKVSRYHALIEKRDDQVVLIDQGSTNGTFLNGKRQQEVVVEAGDEIKVGEWTITLELLDDATLAVQNQKDQVKSTRNGDLHSTDNKQPCLHFCQMTDTLQPVPVLTSIKLPAMFDKPVVSLAELERAKMPMRETTYLTIGGGMGSFTWVDYLVICGADPSQVTAIGFNPKAPYGRYQQLCRNSQIPMHERLRSNSDSCPDNVWGWPGYAVREMWGTLKRGDFRRMGRIGWQIFNEPIAETYTPRSKDVFDSIDREAARIGWDQIWREGRVEAIRQTDDERYVIVYSQPQLGRHGTQMLVVTKYLHLAVGYPGVRFLPDLVEYRQRTGDVKSVINAYESHEHVYEQLNQQGGTVLLRGRGIVASRILQSLNEVRTKRMRENKNPDIRILHLMRSPKPKGHRFGRSRRAVEHHWEFQPFNWPKATWSGTMRKQLEQGPAPQRDELLTIWGGTTTASRRDWREIIHTGRQEGWYDIQFGAVERVERDATSGKVVTIIRNNNIDREQNLSADFIIDATGLDAKLDSNPLLADLMKQYKLPRNPKGRLVVANDFEIEGMRNGTGRMYTAGVMSLGGPYAPVDTFLGLQYAALYSVDSLTKQKAPGLKKLNGIRSIVQWTRWARGVKP